VEACLWLMGSPPCSRATRAVEPAEVSSRPPPACSPPLCLGEASPTILQRTRLGGSPPEVMRARSKLLSSIYGNRAPESMRIGWCSRTGCGGHFFDTIALGDVDFFTSDTQAQYRNVEPTGRGARRPAERALGHSGAGFPPARVESKVDGSRVGGSSRVRGGSDRRPGYATDDAPPILLAGRG